MSYAQVLPSFYEMLQPDSPWHAGGEGWMQAPIPGWGENPALVGPPRLAVNGLGEAGQGFRRTEPPFPARPGFAFKGASYPEYRWVGPGNYQDYQSLPDSPSGTIRGGAPYLSPPESRSPGALRGVDPTACAQNPEACAREIDLTRTALAVAVGVAAVSVVVAARALLQKNKRK